MKRADQIHILIRHLESVVKKTTLTRISIFGLPRKGWVLRESRVVRPRRWRVDFRFYRCSRSLPRDGLCTVLFREFTIRVCVYNKQIATFYFKQMAPIQKLVLLSKLCNGWLAKKNSFRLITTLYAMIVGPTQSFAQKKNVQEKE